MPHKRNPVGATLAAACAKRVQGLSAVLLGAMAHEHERAAGDWHVEWETLRDALAFAAGATSSIREVVEGLEVHTGHMRQNLDMTGGLLIAERVAMLLATRIGRVEAHRLVEEVCSRAVREHSSLRDQLVAQPSVREQLSVEEIDKVLDPAGYVGSAGTFVDRALGAYRREVESA